mmetsp:Transcript_36700/g.67174  ORF Transcript_36700/g.67174 Transcript_36700/m.67174 type:complete len:483 (+) Transcript_36700:81-1529(+)
MSTKLGVSVGGTTDQASLADQIQRYRLLDLPEPSSAQDALNARMNQTSKGAGGASQQLARESLKEKCIKVVVANFAKRPVDEGQCSADHMRAITSALPLDLDPDVGAKHVFDESYWKQCCIGKFGWSQCDLMSHGQMWKQLYFEQLSTERLEQFVGSSAKEGNEDSAVSKKAALTEAAEKGALLAGLVASQDYVFGLKISELRSHLGADEFLLLLPNLSRLDFTLGIKKCAMTHVRRDFGMKEGDAAALARALGSSPSVCPNLTTLNIPGNLIDDDLVRVLMEGLVANDSITSLNMSHNKISNGGARMLSKLLGSQSVLTALDLSDNQIRSEGGRYLGRGLRQNDSLVGLNLRMNRLGDTGGRMLLEGLHGNGSSPLERLNLAGNGCGSESAVALAKLLRGSADGERSAFGEGPSAPPGLAFVDLSCSNLVAEDVDVLEAALDLNRALIGLDLRGNPAIGPEADDALDAIAKAVRSNELAAR